MPRILWGATLAALTLAGAWTVLGGAQAERYTPDHVLRSGREIVVVFIAASFCNAHRVPGFARNVRIMKQRLADRAKVDSARFVAIGVALDWDLVAGFRFLEQFGEFDEISVGRNWLNSGAIKYIWKDVPGRAALPQVQVVARTVDVAKEGITVSREVLLTRLVGTEEVMDWVQRGATLPATPRSH